MTPAAAATTHRPPIEGHRLVGDGGSAFLLRPDAEVDWWCAPDFDSAPLCWSLLDRAGGAARFRDVRYSSRSTEPAGRTARTVLMAGCGRVEVWDGLLLAPESGGQATDMAGPALVRLVRALDGPLDITHEVSVGGFTGPLARWAVSGDVARAQVGEHGVAVAGGAVRVEDGVATTRLSAPQRRWCAVVVAVDGALAADPEALASALAESEGEHATWLRSCRLPRNHAQRALDAMAVLRSCTYAPTGALVAAVTTSLPEAPGHERQWDYRYSWLRDASLAVAVAALLGQRDDAARYLRFIHRITGGRLVPSGPLVSVHGERVPQERVVEGVAGWAASTPVRVGNSAADQVQYDALGLLVEAVSTYVQTGGSLDDDTWRMVHELADAVAAEDPDRPLETNGIWELRSARYLVDGDIGRWLVLDRAVKLARATRPWTRRRRWVRARDVIAARIEAAIDERGMLPQSYGDEGRPDAAGLMAVIFGLLHPRDDPRAYRLVEATVAALDAHPYLYRYPPDGKDGFGGREGAFLPVSFWVVTALAQTGHVEEARSRMDELCVALPRLLPEEVDPASGAGLGNVPLVWSHAELARALYVLDAAERRARHGVVALWVWRLGRYASLRWRPPPGSATAGDGPQARTAGGDV